MRGRRRLMSAVALLAWVAFLAAGLAALHAMSASLAPPPLARPGQVGDWFHQRQPAEVVFALLRLVALVLAWYLLAVTACGLLARALRLATLVRAVDALTVPAVRRMVNGAVGLSLGATALAGPVGTTVVAAEPPAVATMRRLPDGAPPSPPPMATESMRRLPEEPPPTSPPAVGNGTWTVRPGDHFWAVAERTLADAWGRAPADDDVSPYWQSLVAANRDRLRDPRNPDLLFSGQVLVVPAPPPHPA